MTKHTNDRQRKRNMVVASENSLKAEASSPSGRERVSAHELFSLFTADIIKEKVDFRR